MPIHFYGSRALTKAAKPIDFETANAEELNKLVLDMCETMVGANGIGLAAPQIGMSIQLFVAQIGDRVQAFANPSIEEDGEDVAMVEGCLSIPGFHAEVKRKSVVTVRYIDPATREEKVDRLEGLDARVVQHEYDHLKGVLFTSKVSDEDKLKAVPYITNKVVRTKYPMV